MDQQQPEAPAYHPSPTEVIPASAPAKNKRKILALWLLIGPTALIFATLILFAIANFIFTSAYPTETMTTEMFGAPTLGGMLINLMLFFIGATSVAAWLPCITIGIILLNTKQKVA